MAALKASSSGLRAPQAAGSRRAAPRSVASAARSGAARHQPSWQLRAAEVDDVEVQAAIDLTEAEDVVRQALREASIEKAFLDGVSDPDTAKYLSVLEAEAVELDGAAEGVLEAVIGDVVGDVEGDAVAAEVLEETGPKPYLAEEDQEPDVLTGMDNATAVEALRVVDALKLSKAEIETDVVPAKDWDSETLDWFAAPKKGEELPLPEYRLNVLWAEQNIAVAVDQVYARGGVSPLTEYFFWPRKDAWEELRVSLEARPWISEAERVMLLNRLTEVINFWQDLPEGEPRPTIEEARATFADCTFTGATA